MKSIWVLIVIKSLLNCKLCWYCIDERQNSAHRRASQEQCSPPLMSYLENFVDESNICFMRASDPGGLHLLRQYGGTVAV